MIACNKHPRCYVERHCALQSRVALALVEAQAGGDRGALVLLVDYEDPAHVGVGTIGAEALPDVVHTMFWAIGIVQK